MCGRIDQRRSGADYALAIGWDATRKVLGDSQAEPRTNTPPGLYRPVMRLTDGERYVEDLHWGYRAAWATTKLPVAINTRLDKIGSRYWSRLLTVGRCIVPADGWYEWTGEKGSKQPRHIHLKTREPLFMAGLAAFGPFKEHKAESGFTIITADAETWLDRETSANEAKHLLDTAAQPPDDFEWFRVSTSINNSANEAPGLADPIS